MSAAVITFKVCTKCKANKQLSEFNKDKSRKNGVYSYCKICSGDCHKSWRLNNKTSLRFSQNKYSQTEKGRERRKFYRRKDGSRFAGGKASARVRNIEWKLTIQQWRTLVLDQKCHYCFGSLPEIGIALDRKDNDIGYLIGNVVPCCSECNSIKGYRLSYDEMLAVSKLLKKLRMNKFKQS